MSLNAALLLSFVLATAEPPSIHSTPPENSPKFTESQLVQIQVMVAEVSHAKLRRRGFESCGADGKKSFAKSIGSLLAPEHGVSNGNAFTNTPDSNFALGKIADGELFRGLLHAMKEQGLVRVLAEPTIVAMSGRVARMRIGGEVPMPVPDSQGRVTIEFREYGTKVEVLPIVLGGGRIRLEVRPEVSELDTALSVQFAGVTTPGIKTRYVETSIELGSGETYVIGGIFTASDSDSERKEAESDENASADASVASKRTAEQKELIIMVTPKLVEAITKRHDNGDASTPNTRHNRIVQVSLDTDAEEPHSLATSCCRARPCPSICPAEGIPGLFEDASSEGTSDAAADDRAPCKLPTLGALQRIPGCGEECCTSAKTKQGPNSSCCQCPTKQATQASRTADAEADEDDGPGCSEEEFADYVQSMHEAVQARMQWEAAIMHARVTAELARQQAIHTEELMEVQAKHQSELQKAREAVWDVERRAIEAQHREAIKHERELADLRLEQVRKTYEARLASFDIDINWRTRDKAVPASTDAARREGLAPAEFSRPSPSISAAHVAEIDMLRREVCRLHALVEDLLCVTPETPPAPVPQHDPDDSSE